VTQINFRLSTMDSVINKLTTKVDAFVKDCKKEMIANIIQDLQQQDQELLIFMINDKKSFN